MTPSASIPCSIALAGLTVARGERSALSGISLTVDRPGIVALAGPNGAGKSTLLKAIAGLVPYRGAVAFEGRDARTFTIAERARRLAYMPQDRTIHWNLAAADVVALGRLPHRLPRTPLTPADHAAIDRALARVEATALRERPVLELSGGERARVLMARALAQEAPVLLADEPAAGLDPAHQFGLFEALQAVAAEGTRVVVAMHDLAMMARFAATVVLIDQGCLVAVGTPEEVLASDNLRRVYGIETTRHGDDLIVTGRIET